MITGMMARRLAPAETDPHWADVYALLPFDTALNEEVSGNSSWSVISGSTSSASPMLSGSYAAARFSLRSGSSVDIGTQDLTVEMTIRPNNINSSYQALFSRPDFGLYYRNGKIHWYEGGIRAESSILSIGGIYAIMLSRESGVIRTFVNGVKSSSDYGGLGDLPSHKISIGNNEYSTEPSDCDIDEVRITIGVARETANYTPRTTPFPRSGP